MIVWTINTTEEAREYIAKGVDGIASDKPDIFREYCIKLKLWHFFLFSTNINRLGTRQCLFQKKHMSSSRKSGKKIFPGGKTMNVKTLLETKGKDVVSIDAGSTVEDAIRVMNSRKISAMMVTEQSKTKGIFTERDVVRCYLTHEGKSFKDIMLKDVMTTDLIVAQMDDDLNDIMSVMVEKNIRHLPVVEGGNVIGMLSIRDVIQTHVGKLTSEIHYLKDYITGSYT